MAGVNSRIVVVTEEVILERLNAHFSWMCCVVIVLMHTWYLNTIILFIHNELAFEIFTSMLCMSVNILLLFTLVSENNNCWLVFNFKKLQMVTPPCCVCEVGTVGKISDCQPGGPGFNPWPGRGLNFGRPSFARPSVDRDVKPLV